MNKNRGIDHLVLAVRNLDAARETYMALGFTLTPTARHPWGTENCLVQLRGNFLEVLAVRDAASITEAGPGEFSFGAFNRDYLADREGLSQLVFEGHDARADCAEFASAGLDTYKPFDFGRLATLPDGSQTRVSFSLAFVTHPDMTAASFFSCQQHAPELFWKPEYQAHSNSAQLVSEVILVSPSPVQYAEFFAGIQGNDAVTVAGDRLHVRTARGAISVLTVDAYEARFDRGPAQAAPADTHLAAYQIQCASVDKARNCMKRANVSFQDLDDRIVVGPDVVHGVLLEFVQP